MLLQKKMDQVVNYRKGYKGESFWLPKYGPATEYTEQCTKLAANKIPVHTLYLDAGCQPNLQDIATRTGGTCAELLMNGTEGVQKLTTFVTEQVLLNTGGEKGAELVELYRKKYAKGFL